MGTHNTKILEIPKYSKYTNYLNAQQCNTKIPKYSKYANYLTTQQCNTKIPKYSKYANYLNTQQRNDVEDSDVETGRDIGIFFIDSTNTLLPEIPYYIEGLNKLNIQGNT